MSFVLTALVFASLASLAPTQPETVGISAERLERVRAFVAREIGEQRIAGAVTLVARRDQIVFYQAAGMADVEAGDVMKKDSIFRIRSMTKPMVSLAVCMLYEQ